jgi:hypothetical protein
MQTLHYSSAPITAGSKRLSSPVWGALDLSRRWWGWASPSVGVLNQRWWWHQHRLFKKPTSGKDLFPVKNIHIIILHHFYSIYNYSSRIQPRSSYIEIKRKSPYIKIKTKSPYIEIKTKCPYTKYITMFDKNDQYDLCIAPRVCCVQLLASECSPQAIRLVALEVLLAQIRAIEKYATHSPVKYKAQ